MADPLGVDHGLGAGGGGNGLRLGAHALFPGVGDLGTEVQAVDAGMVGFEVRPEHAQAAGELLQAAVVHRGLAFPQVVHEQVTDGPAGELVTVDQFGGRALPCGAQLAQPGRRCRAEGPHLAEQPVAGGAFASGRAVDVCLGVQQLKEIPDGDAGEHAALGGQDDRSSLQRAGAGRGRHGRGGAAVTQRPQPRESFGVAERGHGAGKLGVLASAGYQPGQGGAHDAGADRRDQRRDQRRGHRGIASGPVQPAAGQLPPRSPGGVGSAGQPALLPAAAFLALEPVQQCPQRTGLPGPQAGQMLVHLLAGLRAGGPVRGRRPRREAGPRGPVTRQPHRRRRSRRGGPGGHHVPLPNSTSRLSGR